MSYLSYYNWWVWPTKASYAWNIVIGADLLWKEEVSDLPGKNGGALSLVLRDLPHHFCCSHPRFASTNGPRTYQARLIVPAQDLTYTAVGHLQLQQ